MARSYNGGVNKKSRYGIGPCCTRCEPSLSPRIIVATAAPIASAPVRICLVYDCLFPWTVGGAERWYRNLAERLATDGHEVTYLTRLQWDPADPPEIPGVAVVAVSPAEALYGPDGGRRIGQAVRFGRGVLSHLLHRRGEYDVVHACSFPYFSVLAAAAATGWTPTRLVVDWFEVWSYRYWSAYAGPFAGAVGWIVQALCTRVPQQAFAFSDLHARRLPARRGTVVLRGLFATHTTPAAAVPAEDPPTVVFAGRQIADKRVDAIVPALLAARREIPELRALVLGDGPERPALLAQVAAAGAQAVVRAPGFVSNEEVRAALATATCLLLPSQREGYGMVVIEAASTGTPSVLVRGEDNAATELVEVGVNGFVAETAEAEPLAAALIAAHRGGHELRQRTRRWFEDHREELSMEASLREVTGHYRSASTRR